MMNEQEKEQLLAALKKEMPEYDYKIAAVTTTNDQKIDAVWITAERALKAPLFYPSDYAGMSPEQIAKHMRHVMEQFAAKQDVLKVNLLSPQYVYANVQLQLLNNQKNRIYLSDKPHFRMNHDLSAIFFVKMGLYGNARGIISEELMKTLKLDVSKLRQCALQNMWKNTHLQYLADVCDSITSGEPPSQRNNNMEHIMSELSTGSLREAVVITNTSGMYGSASILCEQFQNNCKQDLIMIPSSTHEIIFLPYNNDDLRELQSVVEATNANMCNPEEILSDNVYIFDHQSHSIALACDKYGYVPICDDTKLQFSQISSKKP